MSKLFEVSVKFGALKKNTVLLHGAKPKQYQPQASSRRKRTCTSLPWRCSLVFFPTNGYWICENLTSTQPSIQVIEVLGVNDNDEV